VPELNITNAAGKSFEVNIDINQNLEEITLDFVKDKVREVVGVENFNLFIESQENPINTDQNIRNILNQDNENDGAINLILISTGDRNLDIELLNQCKKEDNSLDVTRVLIEQGANIDHVDKKVRTPLLRVSEAGHLDIVRYLVEGGADIDKANNYGDTPLLLASYRGHLDIVRYLVEGGADIDSATNNCGDHPFLLASYRGHLDIVRYLVEGGADINKANNNGNTPLLLASYREHLDIVRSLVEGGADINKANNNGDTPLHEVSSDGNIEIVRFLVEHGADIDKTNNNGNTPLYSASLIGYPDVVEYLLAQGADNSCLDKNQRYLSVLFWVSSAILGVLAVTVCAAVPPVGIAAICCASVSILSGLDYLQKTKKLDYSSLSFFSNRGNNQEPLLDMQN
jgi:ankyrin repeat protein